MQSYTKWWGSVPLPSLLIDRFVLLLSSPTLARPRRSLSESKGLLRFPMLTPIQWYLFVGGGDLLCTMFFEHLIRVCSENREGEGSIFSGCYGRRSKRYEFAVFMQGQLCIICTSKQATCTHDQLHPLSIWSTGGWKAVRDSRSFE